jgi:hypothetical protein
MVALSASAIGALRMRGVDVTVMGTLDAAITART